MRKLADYFPDGYDFHINVHDPIVYDIIEMSADAKSLQEVIDSEDFMAALFRGMKRHITLETRYNLFEALEAVKPKAAAKDRRLIKKAQRVLEDVNIDPAIIGVVWQLYVQNLFDKALSRSDLQKAFSNTELKKHIDKLTKKPTPKLIEHVVACGESAIFYIDEFLETNFIAEIAPNILESIIEVMGRIPCHYAARLLGDIALVNDKLSNKILESCQDTGQLEFLIVYITNKLERADTDFFERWGCHELLISLKDLEAFRFLRDELLSREYWTDHPQKKRLRTALSFYSQIFEWLINLQDRRVIPVFIRLLYEGKKMGYQKEVLEIAEDLLSNTEWYEEIQQSLYLLKEGETVFVEKSRDAMSQLNENIEKYTSSVTAVHGKPPKKADIRKKVNYDTQRWNEAYHEELDGLRPIDLPEPEIKLELLEHMMLEFESKVRKRRTPRKKALRILPKFQGRWLTTPRRELGGEIPLALIMRETEMMADTRAQKEHFERYKTETINGLYLEAAFHFDADERIDAVRKVNTVLALDPDYPFAKRLKRQLVRHLKSS
ncbi:MAG: hypothetical protein ACE5I1_06345 [bacterium]